MPTLNVTLNQLDHTASQAQAREHSLIIDRPEAKGGQNKGPLGGETFLMGLGGCFMSNLLAAAKARDVQITNIRSEITAEIGDTPPRLTDIQVLIAGDTATSEELKKLVTIAKRGCALVVTLSRSVNLAINCS